MLPVVEALNKFFIWMTVITDKQRISLKICSSSWYLFVLSKLFNKPSWHGRPEITYAFPFCQHIWLRKSYASVMCVPFLFLASLCSSKVLCCFILLGKSCCMLLAFVKGTHILLFVNSVKSSLKWLLTSSCFLVIQLTSSYGTWCRCNDEEEKCWILLVELFILRYILV
jgi:hypothetical protein